MRVNFVHHYRQAIERNEIVWNYSNHSQTLPVFSSSSSSKWFMSSGEHKTSASNVCRWKIIHLSGWYWKCYCFPPRKQFQPVLFGTAAGKTIAMWIWRRHSQPAALAFIIAALFLSLTRSSLVDLFDINACLVASCLMPHATRALESVFVFKRINIVIDINCT